MTKEHEQWLRYRYEIEFLLRNYSLKYRNNKIEDFFSEETIKEIQNKDLFERIKDGYFKETNYK